jgi:hypothetical protein
MLRRRPNRPSASRSQLRCDSGHTPDPTRQKTRTLGNVSRNFQRNHNPGKGKPKSTEYTAALGKSSFSPIWRNSIGIWRGCLRAVRRSLTGLMGLEAKKLFRGSQKPKEKAVSCWGIFPAEIPASLTSRLIESSAEFHSPLW